jgi:uncharacterized protein (UPF0276 family)
MGSVTTLIEWDGHIPPFERLQEEAASAKRIRDLAIGEAHVAAG